MKSVECEMNTSGENEEVDSLGMQSQCTKSSDSLLLSHLKRVEPLNKKMRNNICSTKNESSTLALIGPTSIQVLDNGKGVSTASDLRRIACSFFVDCIINSVPIGCRKSAKKEIVDLMQNLGVISQDFFADTFCNARRPISLMISKFVVDFCQQHSPITCMFSPNFSTLNQTVSINELSLMSSRYLTDFEEIEQLGVGGFGKVFKVRSKIDNQLYAVKQIRFKSTSESFSKVLSECRYHASLQSEHVVRYHNAWIEFETVPPHNSKKKSHETGKVSSGDGIIFYKDNSSQQIQPTAKEVSLNSSATFQVSNHGGIQKRPLLGGKFWQNFTESSNSSSTDSTSEWSRPNSSADYCDDVKFEFEESKSKSEDALVIRQTVETSIRKWNGKSECHHRKRTSYGPTSSNSDLLVPVLYIQMELCGSTLERYLRERRSINEEFNHTTIFGLLSAIDFLHKNRLIHRDIKPSNVLMKRRNGRMCVLLGDFGLTREVTRFIDNSSTLSGEKKAKGLASGYDYNRICRVHGGGSGGDSPKLTGGIGTAMYAAPEQIASKEYGPLVDVYSAGIVFFELFNSFSTSMERALAVGQLRERCQPDDTFRCQWPMVSLLIEKMVSVDPVKRHSAAQLLNEIREAYSKAAKKCANESEMIVRFHGEVSARTDGLRSNATAMDGDSEISRLRCQNAELMHQLAELKRQLAELSGGGGRKNCSVCRKNFFCK